MARLVAGAPSPDPGGGVQVERPGPRPGAAPAPAPGQGGDDDAQELPKLPVPELEQTLCGYAEATRALVATEQWGRARAAARAFGGGGGAGPRLQEHLRARRQRLDNWAYEWWLHDMYLSSRLPLPVHSNPGMVLPPRAFASSDDAARFAAALVAAVAQHKALVDRGELAVERAASREPGQPLCMAQFYRLLRSHRLPGRPHDRLLTSDPDPDPTATPPHVIVMCAGQMYRVEVRSEAQLCAQLRQVLREAPALAPPPPVALLTAERRDAWADARDLLAQDERNRGHLEAVRRALLVLCLDRPLARSFNARPLRGAGAGHVVGARDETNMAHQMLHGGGSAANSANRWFDATVQLVVSLDGAVGLCYEHSPAEGVAVVQLVEQAYARAASAPAPAPAPPDASSRSPPPPPPPQLLEWAVGPHIVRRLQDAAFNLDSLVRDLDLYVFRFEAFGKQLMKRCRCSPDAFIQLALQLAYYRLYGRLTATYESASTRRFRLGRVDCIRSATAEALAWASAMAADPMAADPMAADPMDTAADAPDGKRVSFSVHDKQKKLDLFDAAIKKQTEIMIQNIMGQGIDIHLLGLREMAKELGEPTPEIFQDEVYKIANHFSLSTSQVSTASDSVMGYGPVVGDGYGASYNPRPHSVTFCLSAFNSCESTSTSRFARSLEESLLAMRMLLAERAAAADA